MPGRKLKRRERHANQRVLRLKAVASAVHSAATSAKLRSRNLRTPICSLIIPKTGSTCHSGSRSLRPLRSGLPPGAGTPRRQARPGPAPPAAQAGQLRFLLLDDLGYLPQSAEESEVLFTLIAERYERRSLGITSNLVFSEWERIFANPMTTAAAIDRVVHHSVILELTFPATGPMRPRNAASKRRLTGKTNQRNSANIVDAGHHRESAHYLNKIPRT